MTADDATGVLPGGSAAAQRARLGPAMDEVRTTPVTPRGAPAPAPPQLLLPGTVIDRYILVEHLGSGGLGDVYKAYDPELDRRIAIKILRSSVVQAETKLGLPWDRLRREAQALAKLHHPNVVVVHDVGEFGEESFIAMGFAEGVALHHWAHRERPGWSRIRDVFLDAGRGLAAAHAAGLVHRDFKPENVVVGPGDGVVVLDFGLARAAEIAFEDSPALREGGDSSLLHREVTGHEILLGTPAYMAPETFRRGETSQASDQFAFCVSMYKVLYGAFPFPRGDVREYVKAVEKGELTPPEGDVPRWLFRVLARGMSGRPEARFENMTALLRALEGDRIRRRRRRLGLVLAVPLLGVAVGAGAWLLRPEPTAEALAIPDQMARAAREAAARGDFVYPPADDPKAPTALSNVLELEALDGPTAARGREVATALRSEFAGALIKFGDRYYAMEGGRPFAADFYAMALMFDPDDSHASGRAQISPTQREAVIERARTASFSGPELAAAEILSALTEEEPEARAKKLRTFLERDAPTGLTTRAAIEALVEPEPEVEPTPEPAPEVEPDVPPTPEPDPPPEDETVLELEGDAPDPARDDTPSGQPKRAAEEVSRGNAELAKGRLAAAEAHYHRAMELAPSSFGAHLGLANCAFERGSYSRAAKLAKKATSLRPRSAAAFMLLGNARFKTLDYAAARKAYQRARDLGSKEAEAGLARLSKRLGE